ncbi:hypothetical protein [Exiguobacterium sp. s26]|uniref:hypothetical protein n=1 Tax=Exiguobacterium sp. s26 TaxID=2751231 RepID=UPI001BE82DD5|nr:hypothetical protein [Exiguobacterium sp. s26]
MISLKHFNTVVVSLYVFLMFFIIPIEWRDYLTITLVMLVSLSFLLKKGEKTIKVKYLFFLIFLIALLMIISLTTDFTIVNIAYSTVFILILFYIFHGENYSYDKMYSKFDWIYLIALTSITLQLIFQLINGGIYFGDFSLYSAWDRNYAAIALFLFISYCDKRKYKFGLIIGFIYAYYIGSRSFILMLLLLYSVKGIKKVILYFKKNKNNSVRNQVTSIKIFIIFIGIFFVSSAFSYYWVFHISDSNVSSYHEGLNDNSNAVRFRGNINALELLANDKHLLLYGYDNEIRSALNIDNSIDSHEMYLGYRLVQPHNSIINMLIKNGIIYSIIYLIMLSVLLRKYFNFNNLEYIIPFLVNSMIMHEMFITGYLFFWIFVLSVPIKSKTYKKALNFRLKVSA